MRVDIHSFLQAPNCIFSLLSPGLSSISQQVLYSNKKGAVPFLENWLLMQESWSVQKKRQGRKEKIKRFIILLIKGQREIFPGGEHWVIRHECWKGSSNKNAAKLESMIWQETNPQPCVSIWIGCSHSNWLIKAAQSLEWLVSTGPCH